VSEARSSESAARIAGSILIAAAIVIAVVNNDTYRWAIAVPLVLAIVGVGLRIEAAIRVSQTR
jgi:hypothetical protein